jgi:nucleoside 2-deoxyribosyltransferase
MLYYLAHPYSAPTPEGELENFNKVTRIAAELIKRGMNVYSPLTHTHPIHLVEPQSWERWIELDEEFMSRCDALILCPGWENSRGCRHERSRFVAMGKTVIWLDVDTNICEIAAEELNDG